MGNSTSNMGRNGNDRVSDSGSENASPQEGDPQQFPPTQPAQNSDQQTPEQNTTNTQQEQVNQENVTQQPSNRPSLVCFSILPSRWTPIQNDNNDTTVNSTSNSPTNDVLSAIRRTSTGAAPSPRNHILHNPLRALEMVSHHRRQTSQLFSIMARRRTLSAARSINNNNTEPVQQQYTEELDRDVILPRETSRSETNFECNDESMEEDDLDESFLPTRDPSSTSNRSQDPSNASTQFSTSRDTPRHELIQNTEIPPQTSPDNNAQTMHVSDNTLSDDNVNHADQQQSIPREELPPSSSLPMILPVLIRTIFLPHSRNSQQTPPSDPSDTPPDRPATPSDDNAANTASELPPPLNFLSPDNPVNPNQFSVINVSGGDHIPSTLGHILNFNRRFHTQSAAPPSSAPAAPTATPHPLNNFLSSHVPGNLSSFLPFGLRSTPPSTDAAPQQPPRRRSRIIFLPINSESADLRSPYSFIHILSRILPIISPPHPHLFPFLNFSDMPTNVNITPPNNTNSDAPLPNETPSQPSPDHSQPESNSSGGSQSARYLDIRRNFRSLFRFMRNFENIIASRYSNSSSQQPPQPQQQLIFPRMPSIISTNQQNPVPRQRTHITIIPYTNDQSASLNVPPQSIPDDNTQSATSHNSSFSNVTPPISDNVNPDQSNNNPPDPNPSSENGRNGNGVLIRLIFSIGSNPSSHNTNNTNSSPTDPIRVPNPPPPEQPTPQPNINPIPHIVPLSTDSILNPDPNTNTTSNPEPISSPTDATDNATQDFTVQTYSSDDVATSIVLSLLNQILRGDAFAHSFNNTDQSATAAADSAAAADASATASDANPQVDPPPATTEFTDATAAGIEFPAAAAASETSSHTENPTAENRPGGDRIELIILNYGMNEVMVVDTSPGDGANTERFNFHNFNLENIEAFQNLYFNAGNNGSQYENLLRIAEILGPARPRNVPIEDVNEGIPVVIWRRADLEKSYSMEDDAPNDTNNSTFTKNNMDMHLDSSVEIDPIEGFSITDIPNDYYSKPQYDEDTSQCNNDRIPGTSSSPRGDQRKLGLCDMLGSNEKCSICLTNYEEGDELRIIKCQHGFHKECIDKWLVSYVNSCPVCRNKVITPHAHKNQTIINETDINNRDGDIR